jgi:hypothetical protein
MCYGKIAGHVQSALSVLIFKIYKNVFLATKLDKKGGNVSKYKEYFDMYIMSIYLDIHTVFETSLFIAMVWIIFLRAHNCSSMIILKVKCPQFSFMNEKFSYSRHILPLTIIPCTLVI